MKKKKEIISSGTLLKKQFSSRSFTWVACSLFTLGLAAQPALADFTTGFEAGEVGPAYIGAATTPPEGTGQPSSELPGQANWGIGFGNTFDVYTYPGQVTWFPGGVETTSPAPFNPTGGEQFIAMGDNNGRNQLTVSYTPGLVEVSADYAAGFDGDYAPRQGQLRYGPNIGIAAYTSDAWDEGAVDGYDGTEWAWNLDAFDAAGTKISNNENYYRFNGVAGFDNLTREKWYRMGIVVDLDPASSTYRQIMQLKSQDITAGVTTIMDNPVGPLGELMYMEGGTAGTTLPDDLGFYNVGRGSLSMFDNAYVGAPYEWPAVPEPSSAVLLIMGLTSVGVFGRRRRR